MSIPGLSLIFPLLFMCSLRETSCICDGSLWRRVGWEILPEEMQYLKVELAPSHCLPYPMDNICYNFAHMDIFQDCLYLMHILLQALFLILSVLSVPYLWMKWRKHKKKLKKKGASLDIFGDDLRGQFFQEINKILCELVATSSMITKNMNKVPRYPSTKKFKHRNLKKIRVKEKKPEVTDYTYMQA